MKISRPRAGLAAFAAATLALAAIGWWLLFSNFALWDDEGYVLMAAREYFTHGHLYDRVYSQYGPAFHAAMDAVQHLLRMPVDHTMARWLTLACWLATALGCAGLAWRGTASRSLALFTLAATFLYLYFLPDAPFHPGPCIVALLAVTTWLLVRLVDGERWRLAAAVAGATSAVLLLTKINVGVFHLAAIGAWALLHADSPALRRFARPAMMIGLPLIAAVVMHTLIAETWVHIYLGTFGAGVIAVIATMRSEGGFSLRHLGAGVTAALVITGVVLALIALRGTSAAGLLDGALLGPLRHPGNYSYAVDWRHGTLAVAALSLALALALPWLRRRDEGLADRIIVAIRIVQAVALAAAVVWLMHGRVIGAVFSYVAPLVWTWVVPLTGDTTGQRSARSRTLLALILLLQYLHAYPVGGSQLSWGTFLLFPLVALGLGDLRRRWQEDAGPAAAWRAMSAALVTVAIGKLAWTALESQRRYAARTDLALPGAGGLRLEEKYRTAYRVLALNASVHADMLFSLPGMFSFNIWTSLPAPTARNTTLWFSLLNEAEQRDIISRLRATPRACVIVQEALVEHMRAGNVPMRGPLHDYVHEHFALAFRVEGFAFLVHSGRAIAPLGLGRVTPVAAVNPAASNPDRRVEFTVVGDDTPVASLAVAGNTLRLDARNARVATTAIDRAGNSLRPTAPAVWPWPCKGVTRVTIDVAPEIAGALAEGAVLQLLAADGRTLHEVRITAP